MLERPKFWSDELFALLYEAMVSSKATLMYTGQEGVLWCVVDDIGFEFREQEEESYFVDCMGLKLLLLRETGLWAEIRAELQKVPRDVDDETANRIYLDCKRRIARGVIDRLQVSLGLDSAAASG